MVPTGNPLLTYLQAEIGEGPARVQSDLRQRLVLVQSLVYCKIPQSRGMRSLETAPCFCPMINNFFPRFCDGQCVMYELDFSTACLLLGTSSWKTPRGRGVRNRPQHAMLQVHQSMRRYLVAKGLEAGDFGTFQWKQSKLWRHGMLLELIRREAELCTKKI